jgi:hypothetical protein
VYGPVRTVVWEGQGREALPYPDHGRDTPSPRFKNRGHRVPSMFNSLGVQVPYTT